MKQNTVILARLCTHRNAQQMHSSYEWTKQQTVLVAHLFSLTSWACKDIIHATWSTMTKSSFLPWQKAHLLPGLNVYYLETNSELKLDSAAGIINSESSTTNIITRKRRTYTTSWKTVCYTHIIQHIHHALTSGLKVFSINANHVHK